MFYSLLDPYLLKRYKVDAQKTDPYSAAQNFIKNTNLSTQVVGQLPTTGPTLVISNHPTSIDLLTMLSLVKRKDFKVIAAVVNDVLGSDYINKRIPVYISQPIKLGLVLFSPRNYLLRSRENKRDPQESRALNRQGISQAAKNISTGQMVTIFPTGGDFGDHTNWKNGVGFLVAQITNPDTQIVFVKIDDFGKLTQARFFTSISKKLFPHKTIKINISQPKKLKDLHIDKAKPKQITQILKQHYLDFFIQIGC